MFKVAACVVILSVMWTQGSAWTYTNQAGWDPRCQGETQSPIDIISSRTQKKNLGTFNFNNYNSKPATQTLYNDGHTAKVDWPGISQSITGGNLPSTYKFLQYHFHWGRPSDNRGSEHLIDGHQAALELHLVHWNTAYGDVGTALGKSDGLAVLGMLYDVGAENEALKPIIAQLGNVINEGDHTVSDGSFPSLGSLLPSDTTRFYRYYGSLTTPTCNEAVVWTVFAQRLSVSNDQLNEFRKMKDSTGTLIDFNYRDVQSTRATVVYYNQKRRACGIQYFFSHGAWCVYI